MISVSDQEITSAATHPLPDAENRTSTFCACVAPKPVPWIVTVAPWQACRGEISVMVPVLQLRGRRVTARPNSVSARPIPCTQLLRARSSSPPKPPGGGSGGSLKNGVAPRKSPSDTCSASYPKARPRNARASPSTLRPLPSIRAPMATISAARA